MENQNVKPIADPRLDRRVEFDEKSRKFPIMAVIPFQKPRTKTWDCKIWLDQGQEGACTGFAMAHELAARPIVVRNVTDDLARQIYQRARQLDEWPGEDYSGSSVLGAVKAVQEMGKIQEYRWAFGIDDLILALSWKGPAVLGVNWYEGMYSPDENGLIHVSGNQVGGHAILARGYSRKKKAILLRNSWGVNWGVAGDCWISIDDLARLLKEDGEACIPIQRLK